MGLGLGVGRALAPTLCHMNPPPATCPHPLNGLKLLKSPEFYTTCAHMDFTQTCEIVHFLWCTSNSSKNSHQRDGKFEFLILNYSALLAD